MLPHHGPVELVSHEPGRRKLLLRVAGLASDQNHKGTLGQALLGFCSSWEVSLLLVLVWSLALVPEGA